MSLRVPMAVALAVFALLSPAVAGAVSSSPLPPASTAPPTSSGLPSEPSSAPSASPEMAAVQGLLGDGVPALALHVPNLAAERAAGSGRVAPLFTSAPAPMGLADLGLKNVSGTLTPYTYTTPSVEGNITLDRAVALYPEGDGPDVFSLQLNAVATGVAVGGAPALEYWAQDTATYVPSLHRLTLVDDLWNFSGVVAPLPASTLYAHGPSGSLAGAEYYYNVGPNVTVSYPFQVTFLLNATVVGGRPAITFAYAVASAPVNSTLVPIASGTFDTVVFNASAPSSPAPAFTVDGSAKNPAGLLDDLELVLTGSGAGDTTSFYNATGRLSLDYDNLTAGKYVPVPAAFNAGADTGETSDGVAVGYLSAGTAVFASGPSFLGGLWNATGTAGFRKVTDNQAPVNAFLFASPGPTFNASSAQWVPSFPLAGATPPVFVLPNTSTFSLEWLLSGWQEQNGTVPSGSTPYTIYVNLTANATSGTYTPLVAFGNTELRSIRQTGNGSPTNPYVLKDRPGGPINLLFGELNDFGYGVFPGVLLVNTTKSVDVSPATFAITYPSTVAPILAAWNLPGTNDLPITFVSVTNVSVLGGGPVSGWFPTMAAGLFDASLLFWNSSGNLVAGTTFDDQGIALALQGGSHNTVWGNTFLTSSVPSLGPNATLDAANETGLVLAESGDLVYNNYFDVPAPALTPAYDPATCLLVCAPATYVDAWNGTHEPASIGRIVLGTNLSGSILHTPDQGGNYWSNYGSQADPYADLPYTDGGAILTGGDAWPLLPYTLYNVTITASGLPSAATWGADLGGIVETTTAGTLTFADPNGSYGVAYVAPSGFAGPAAGNVTLQGGASTLTAHFHALSVVTFHESGLVANWSWNVSVVAANGTGPNASASSNATSAVVSLENGTYNFTVASAGYNATPAKGSFVVPTTTSVDIAFHLGWVAYFVEVNLSRGTAWYVTITQGSRATTFTSANFSIQLPLFDFAPGSYSWAANATGWTGAPASGAGTTGTRLVVDIYFTAIPGTLNGTVNVPGATVAIDGVPVTVANGAFSKSLVPGIHNVVAVAPGYYTFVTTVVIYPHETASLTIVMGVRPPTDSFDGISYAGWAGIATLAAVAAVLGVFLVRGRRRGRTRPPPAAVAPAAAAAGASPASSRAAWEEGPASEPPAPPTTRSPWDEGESGPRDPSPRRGA